jgi:hypothetical protein
VDNHQQPSSTLDSLGCGLLGCLGGLILGLFGGGALLVFVSLASAILAPTPTPTPTPLNSSDVRIALNENFLNQFIEQPSQGAVRADILPANQIRVTVNTSLDVLGLPAPVEITGLFQLHLTSERLELLLLETQVSGLELPPDLNEFFSEDVALANQDIATLLDEISRRLGTPIRLNGLTTDQTRLQLELRTGP